MVRPPQTTHSADLTRGAHSAEPSHATHSAGSPRGARLVGLLRTLPVPLVLVALIALAGVTLGRIYAGALLTQLVVGAALGSVAVSLAVRRLPSWLVAPVSVVALAGYTLAALRLAADRAQVPGTLADVVADALRNGIPRLLTAMIPVEPTPDTVVVPVVAAWLAGLAGAEVAVRAGRVLLGYTPAAALYAGAVYVVGPNAPAAVGPTLAFAALAATGLAVTGRPPVRDRHALPAPTRAALRARAAAGAAAGTVVVVALAVLLGPWVAGRVATTPVDPRRYVQPPQVDSLDESPLVRISGWALNPDQRLFDVTTRVTAAPGDEPGPGGLGTGGVDPADAGPDEAGTGPDEAGTGPGTADPADTDGGGADPADADPADARPQGAGPGSVRVRLAVLPDYDGVTWRVGATYRGAGRVLPQPPVAEGVRVDTVEQEITVADLTGRLLPAVPTPHTVHGARVAYDPGTGTLIRPEGLTAGLRYTVTSARERPDLNLLPAADVPAGAAVARFLRLGDGVPEPLQRLAGQLAEENGAPYERAAAIEQFLGEHYRLVADAPSGHAYPNLTFFLFGPRQGGGQRGTSEQFAASFAVLGRLMGLPTRVVVGFRAPTGGAAVRGADAYAWPEVLFEDLGWVAFDPLPRPDTRPRPVEEDFKPEPENSSAPSEAPTPTAGPTEPAVQPAAAAPARGRGTAALGAGLAATVPLAVAGGAAAVVVLRRAQRRRRLDTGDPAHRIAGAWLEVTDALRLAGRPASRHLAATEVAAHAVAAAGQPPVGAPVRLPVPPIDDLAALVNTSTFAPGATDEAQARRAAAQAVAFASELRARRRWWQRVWWTVHPGPLRWHRRR